MRHVLIIEDISEVREWLISIITRAFPECRVRAVKDKRSGVYEARTGAFDLALIDLGLPDGSGVEVISAFREHQPDALLVVATVMGDDTSIIAALKAGAHGYLLKDTAEDRFVRQLQQLNQGLQALSPSIARRIMQHFRETAVEPQTALSLTKRETEVLALIGRGLRNSDAAKALNLTEHTVASHIKSIYSKLNISSRAEAALQAERMGLNR